MLKPKIPFLLPGAVRFSGRVGWTTLVWSVCLLLVTFAAQAQNTSTISGTVHDSSSALVSGAKVTLINEASKAVRTTTGNREGYFNFSAVQPATYSIQVFKNGFEGWKVTGVEVHPGDSLTVPKITLTVGQVVDSVVVTAEVAGVTLNSPEHSTMISSADIDRLSTTGRDALELVAILPGFTLNAGTGLTNSGPDYTTTSFGSGNLGSFGANGSAPQSGQVNITSDGAQVIDPGDMGATVANVNMDQVSEVKVQTSNFGADEAKGPIVINAVGKSGGSSYHGSLYTYLRNHEFNTNDWMSNDSGTTNAQGKYVPVTKTAASYYYPGGTIGGPVRVPGTQFNKANHLVFWAGYEQYQQNNNVNGSFGGPNYAFVPNAAMVGGDLSTATIAGALNLDPTTMAANCTADWNQTAAYTNIGGVCYSPAGGLDENGNTVPSTGTNAGHLAASAINPASAYLTKFYPAINRTPGPANGYASDGYNWAENVMATNNGYQLHTRVDENISDNLKLYGVYNLEKVNSEAPMQNLYWTPGGTVPYPTPLYSNGYSDYATLNLTQVISGTMTNEVIVSGVYFNQPQQFGDRSKAMESNTPWAAYAGGALKNGDLQLPRIYSWEGIGIPNFSITNVPAAGEYLHKSSWNISDNLTKIFRTHTLKVGAYIEQTRNNQVTLGSDANGEVTYDRYESCLINQNAPILNPVNGTIITPTKGTGLGNTVANFLAGCPGGYNQSTNDPSLDMYFNSLEFYATDEWKVNNKLTLTLGVRLSHLPPWQDSHGIGAAVWNPEKYTPIQQGVFDPNVTSDTTTFPGISWHARDKSIPVAGVGSRPLFYAPRLGLAYDFYGNGKTVFRGGWGAYRSRDSYNLVAGALTTSIDLVDHSIIGNYSCTLDQLMNSSNTPTGSQVLPCGYYGGSYGSFTGATAVTHGSTVSVSAVNANDNEQPVTYNYNFTLDQALPRGISFEVAYVGNQSAHLATQGNLQNVNAIPLGAFFGPDPLTGQINVASNIPSADTADYRPYPNYSSIYVPAHTNWSNYNAMQVSLNKQRGSLVVGANYTWSKSMAVRGNYDTGTISDPVNPHHDYGVTSYDRPQVLNLTYSYVEGSRFHVKRQLGWVINNWELSGITSLQSGPDIAIATSSNFGFSASAGYVNVNGSNLTSVSIPVNASTWLGSSDYAIQPTVTCDPRRGLHSAVDPASGKLDRQYVNGKCFSIPTQGTQGWWNLPDVHGPAYEKSDLSVYKDIKLNAKQNFQLRMSAFNFLNHPISSFTSASGNALSLTFADPACNATTGVGCATSQSSAFSQISLQNAGFGKTPYKWGVRIVEFGAKYNF